MLHVFDSGAGGYYVSMALKIAGIENKLATYPDMFPFGDKSHDELIALFEKFRSENEGTIFCACNTMSLVLQSVGYDFKENDVIPTFPNFDADAPVCYGTKNTVALAGKLHKTFRGQEASKLVAIAEDVYQGRLTAGEAREVFEATVKEKIQLGSTHLSYLAHHIGLSEQHVEPDYVALYRAHVGEIE